MKGGILYVPMSRDKKTGAIGTTYSSYALCPAQNCPWHAKCYGRHYPCALHANRVTAGKAGMPWEILSYQVKVKGVNPYMVRVNVTGDMCRPGTDDLWADLVQAHRDAFKDTMYLYTYTHARLTSENLRIMRDMGEQGFTINASCETHAQVKKALKAGVPAVLAVVDQPQGTVVRDGVKYTTCPAAGKRGITCATCRMCVDFKRDAVVVLPYHGRGKKDVPPDFLMPYV